jgi:hypothetical protein
VIACGCEDVRRAWKYCWLLLKRGMAESVELSGKQTGQHVMDNSSTITMPARVHAVFLSFFPCCGFEAFCSFDICTTGSQDCSSSNSQAELAA